MAAGMVSGFCIWWKVGMMTLFSLAFCTFLDRISLLMVRSILLMVLFLLFQVNIRIESIF